jgi:glycine/D-amino acid oxidase-like deaminating enzyme/nitrite reductase/ring-hydroxylating ferredoxin subunit
MVQNKSFWWQSCDKKNYPPLEGDLKTDSLVVGGGLSGITVAYLLNAQQVPCALIEANEIMSGVSGNTTAKITAQHGLIYNRILKRQGRDCAKLYAEANSNAIDLIERLSAESGGKCGFKRTYACIVTESKDYVKQLEAEAETALTLGIRAEFIRNPEFDALKKANVLAAVKFYNQAQFNPAIYMNSLAENFVNKGGKIYEQTRATDIIKGKTNCVVTDKGYKIYAKHIIVATHFPFYDKRGLYFTRLYPQRAYICSFTANNSFNEGMFITAEEGFSLRSHPYGEGNIILLAGCRHDTGKGYFLEKNYKTLENYAKRLFDVKEFLWKWSAQDYSTPSGLPYGGFLCNTLPGVYVMTGYDKWGMTNATAAAVTITNIILNKQSPYKKVYSPQKFPDSFYTVFNYLGKNLRTVYRLVRGRLKTLPHRGIVKKGEGRLLKINGKRVGVYRDNSGNLHIVKAICKHLGCQLCFNDAEKTWDCPCHGSRYDIDGNVIESPATEPLCLLKFENKNN